jgi:hypothetical protein
MKYGAGPTMPTTSDVAATRHEEWAFDIDGLPLSAIEDRDPARAVRAPTTRSDRLIGLVVAGCAALICFGFAGHLWTPDDTAGREIVAPPTGLAVTSIPPVAEAPSPFVLDRPADGATVEGGRIHVHGLATLGVGEVHVAIALGSAILGWANLDVDAGGRIDGDVRFFEPAFAVPLDVVVTGRTAAGTAFEVRREIAVPAGAPLTIWQRRILPASGAKAGTGSVLVVDGSARSSITIVSVVVRTRHGRVVARGTASNGREDYRPGSVGGALIGRGSFHATIAVPGPVPADGWLVEVSWSEPDFDVGGSVEVVVGGSADSVGS